MSILEKISAFLNDISKKPDLSTYESRQAHYKKHLPRFGLYIIFMICLIAVIPASFDSGNAKSFEGVVEPIMFILSLYTLGTLITPYINMYSSIDDETFLDKILPLKFLKSIKRNHSFNISNIWFHAIMLAAPVYVTVDLLYPLYGTYPLMEPSGIFFESEKLTSTYEGLAIFVMLMYLFGNTTEQNYVKNQEKKKKFEDKNITIAKIKIGYEYVNLSKLLFIITIMASVLISFPRFTEDLLNTKLYVEYSNQKETKVIPFNQIGIITSYSSPGVELYNAALMGEPLSQSLLLMSFTEVEYKETPELSRAIAFSLMKGLKEVQSSKSRVEMMSEKYPVLKMDKERLALYNNQSLTTEIKLLDLIYKNDLKTLKSELEKHHSEIFVSPKEAVKEGKESIAPLSVNIISHMVKSGNFEYEVSYFRTKDRTDYEPKHEAAKEMVKLMKFFESAHRVK